MQSVPFVDRQPKSRSTADCECCSGRWNICQKWSNGPLTLQEEKRQKAEQCQKAPEASAFSSSSMSPLLAAVAEKRASLGKNKERRKATREERAIEGERALLKKQRAEHWQGIKR